MAVPVLEEHPLGSSQDDSLLNLQKLFTAAAEVGDSEIDLAAVALQNHGEVILHSQAVVAEEAVAQEVKEEEAEVVETALNPDEIRDLLAA